MAVTVKSIKLWRKEIDNRPGELAGTLGPLVSAGADFQVLMGYRFPGNESKAAVELYPVSGKKATAAAGAAGLQAAEIPCLMVEGDNKPGVAQSIAKSIADAGINMNFVVAQSVGRRYSAIFGFDTDADTRKAASLIKKAASKKR
ncbi:MAG TPA: hypothetical protein VLG74_00355 [Blastocatellia bacterium]|nr:hypothetical protein [Blastocatellia bacterium]